MDNNELSQLIIEFAHDNNLKLEDCIPIHKNQLVEGSLYRGICRNASYAEWIDGKFRYERYKFGDIYIDSVNHYEDDDGYDVFIPFMEVT